MSTAIKVILYLVIVMAVYVEEYNIPVMLYVKRTKFLADWTVAAHFQKKALQSYMAYQKEAEYVRG